MAPSYVIIFMGYLENKILQQAPVTPFLWHRFIDDVFNIWALHLDKINSFFKFINTFHDTIKFTMESSQHSIPFLDVRVHIDSDGCIQTDLFKKPTDTNQYLHFKSAHPRHMKLSIPFSLAIRICRICSKPEWRDSHLDNLRTSLVQRGYPENLVTNHIERAKSKDRQDLLSYKQETSQQHVPLVTTYSPYHPDFRKIVKSHFKILHKSPRCQKAIPSPPVIAFRRSKNLRDMLVHTKLSNTQLAPGFFRCGSTRGCNICKFSTDTAQFKSNINSKTFEITNNITCKSRNILYLINCKRCHKQYVGETKTTLRLRFNNHLSTIRHNSDYPVAIHFNSDQHTINDVSIIGIIQINKDDDKLRKHLESVWIKKLESLSPKGLNARP